MFEQVETVSQTESVSTPSESKAPALAGGRKQKAAAAENVVSAVVQEVKSAPEMKPDAEGNVSLKIGDLVALIGVAVDNAVTKSSKVIAEAMIEARKPYVDPNKAINDEIMAKQTRENHARIRKQIEADRENCPHVQGSNALSEVQGTLGSFVLHRLDTGETIGICTNCQKIIRSTVPGDREFFRRKNANRMSKSGDRTFIDPLQAQIRGRLVDQP